MLRVFSSRALERVHQVWRLHDRNHACLSDPSPYLHPKVRRGRTKGGVPLVVWVARMLHHPPGSDLLNETAAPGTLSNNLHMATLSFLPSHQPLTLPMQFHQMLTVGSVECTVNPCTHRTDRDLDHPSTDRDLDDLSDRSRSRSYVYICIYFVYQVSVVVINHLVQDLSD